MGLSGTDGGRTHRQSDPNHSGHLEVFEGQGQEAAEHKSREQEASDPIKRDINQVARYHLGAEGGLSVGGFMRAGGPWNNSRGGRDETSRVSNGPCRVDDD